MSILPSFALVGGEALLSLYPIIVKKTPLPIDWQIFSRLLIYSVIPLFLGNLSALASIPLVSWIGVAIANYIHIYSSYKGFQILAPGLAMSLLYLYPVFNLILLMLFFNLSLSPAIVLFFTVPIALIYSIYMDRELSQPQDRLKGVAFMLIASITESIIYLFLRFTATGTNPWNAIFFVYIGSLAIAIALFASGIRIDKFQGNVSDFIKTNYRTILLLLLANVFIGSVGHMLRFFSIPLLPPVLFAILSFTGIITSHLFGNWFVGELITTPTAAKLLVFIISLIIIKSISYAEALLHRLLIALLLLPTHRAPLSPFALPS
jgi:drug/metabolite transporter (DMT)-like permease